MEKQRVTRQDRYLAAQPGEGLREFDRNDRPAASMRTMLQEFLPRSMPRITISIGLLLSPNQRRYYPIATRGVSQPSHNHSVRVVEALS